MNNSSDWKKNMFQEKNFLEVYFLSRGVVGARSNTVIASIFLLVLLGLELINIIYFSHELISLDDITRYVREWASVGVTFSTGILGFLITGFSIFASVTKPTLFITLAKIRYKKGNITRLQFVFFNFLIVFINYITFVSICLIVVLGFGVNGFLTKIVGYFIGDNILLKIILSNIALLFLGTYFVIIILMLKSFLWNLYQSVLISIATEAEMIERELKPEDIIK